MIGTLVAMASVDPFVVMNAIGLVAFALVGATKATEESFDVFGVAVVGLSMAFVGGATRDLLVVRTPLVLQSPTEVALGLFGVVLAIAVQTVYDSPNNHPITVVADAIGLAAFTTAGAIVAATAGISAFGVVTIGTVNAVGGGAFADLLLDRSPFILFEDVYASCAVAGGTLYVLVGAVGIAGSTAAACCAGATVCTRLLAVRRGWELPVVGGE